MTKPNGNTEGYRSFYRSPANPRKSRYGLKREKLAPTREAKPVNVPDPDSVTKPVKAETDIELPYPTLIRRRDGAYYTFDKPTGEVVPLPTGVEKVPFDPEELPSKNIYGSHLAADLDPDQLRKRVAQAVRALSTWDFDTIAFRGVSGTILSVPIALAMNKEMILVRKEHDDSHSALKVEGSRDAKRYVIVDDFVASGRTARKITEHIRSFAPNATCLGVLITRGMDEEKLARAEGWHGHDPSPYPLYEVVEPEQHIAWAKPMTSRMVRQTTDRISYFNSSLEGPAMRKEITDELSDATGTTQAA